ncbi:MAG: hypothetical protein NVSMB4_00420 [Acidimicrobiales bacterium]
MSDIVPETPVPVDQSAPGVVEAPAPVEEPAPASAPYTGPRVEADETPQPEPKIPLPSVSEIG